MAEKGMVIPNGVKPQFLLYMTEQDLLFPVSPFSLSGSVWADAGYRVAEYQLHKSNVISLSYIELCIVNFISLSYIELNHKTVPNQGHTGWTWQTESVTEPESHYTTQAS